MSGVDQFICKDCGNIFYGCEATIRREPHDEVDNCPSEYLMFCPACGSDDFEDAAYCEKCGGAFLEDKLVSGYYCTECLDEFLGTRYAHGFAKENLSEFAEYVHEKEECKCSSVKGT